MNEWKVPPAVVCLGGNDVHVWRASLRVSEAVQRELWHLLDNTERIRAGRFRFEMDRRRYIAAHGIARIVLSRYADVRPQHLRFECNPHGKPALVGTFLTFNLSHTDDMLLCAVARHRPIGVDVEHVRADVEYEQLAGHIFSPRERALWAALPSTQQPAAFFQAWVRKEAYVKALGIGLELSADQCEAPLAPDQYFDGCWSWCSIDPGRGYVGALVMAGRGASLSQWKWTTKTQLTTLGYDTERLQ